MFPNNAFVSFLNSVRGGLDTTNIVHTKDMHITTNKFCAILSRPAHSTANLVSKNGRFWIQQPANPRLHWMPIVVDGTSRHEALYVHCNLTGPCSPNQLSSRWLRRGHKTLFEMCADGKAQILMANCKNWNAEAPQSSVCWVHGHNRADCLVNFPLESSIDGCPETVLPVVAIYRHVSSDGRRLRVA